jgi:hypothetical protein
MHLARLRGVECQKKLGRAAPLIDFLTSGASAWSIGYELSPTATVMCRTVNGEWKGVNFVSKYIGQSANEA